MPKVNWKSLLRFILVKAIGVLVAVILLPLALFLLCYPLAALATNQGGKDAKVVAVNDHLGKIKTGYRVGGLFTISTEDPGAKKPKKNSHHSAVLDEKIYCFYPAWPDQLQPSEGDLLKVWPAKKPLVGAPTTEGWGWFIVGTVFVLGLVTLEFIFLALTMA